MLLCLGNYCFKKKISNYNYNYNLNFKQLCYWKFYQNIASLAYARGPVKSCYHSNQWQQIMMVYISIKECTSIFTRARKKVSTKSKEMMMNDKISVELDNLKLPRTYKSVNYQISWIPNAEWFLRLFSKKKKEKKSRNYKNTTLDSIETWYKDYKE